MPRKQSQTQPPNLQAADEAADAIVDHEKAFVTETYQEFFSMWTTWHSEMPLLGNRTPYDFWNDCERDYGVLMTSSQDEDDPIQEYESTVSRDKTDAFYASLASKMGYPSVIAQNMEQSIDRAMGRVGDALLYWSFRNDGWPNESGQQKLSRVIHKCCVTGTAYVLDVVTKDGLESEMVPNEEILFPNLWQPNLQKQSVVMRSVLNITRQEAEEMFGHLKEWDNVKFEGWQGDFMVEQPELKDEFTGVLAEDKVSILYVWKRATQKQLKELKKKRKVYAKAKRAWYYNIIVNNKAMFPPDHVSPYKSGILPLSKMVFEYFAKSEFALGNSVPNKCKQDKRWKDAWKTNIRYRGQLAGMPPQLVWGGHIDAEDVMIPGKFTDMTGSPEDSKVMAVPGVVPPGNADMLLMNMGDTEIDRSTISPSQMGQRPDEKQTARAEVIQANAAQQMMEPFAQQLAFLQMGRSFHVLTALLQMMPKGDLKRIAVPDQTLDDGLTGTFEVFFREIADVLSEVPEEEMAKARASLGEGISDDDIRNLLHSSKVLGEEKKSRSAGQPKDVVYISPSYAQDIKFYLYADATNVLQDKSAMRKMEFNQQYQLMANDPYFLPLEVRREWMKINGFNERILNKQGGQAPAGQMPVPGQAPQAAGPVDAASQATTGQKLPALT